MIRKRPYFLSLLLLLGVHLLPARAVDPKVLDGLKARPIGPTAVGGRVTAIAVVENKLDTIYVASASGGVWKTTDNGKNWAAIFDDQPTLSIGDVAVAPSRPETVWVGTGEANARNSVSWGSGVYRSIDGGKTWTACGLKDSHHIGRIVIHPKDSDTVYVAALGHVWAPNKERGVFKTTDGGRTWSHSLAISDEVGCVDLVMDQTEPDRLYAAAYGVRRDAFAGGNPAVQTHQLAGIYASSDAGQTWNKLTNGLPGQPIGRCGLAISRKDPRILYAVIQTDKTTLIRANELGQAGRPNDKTETGGVFRSDDHGRTWTKVNDLCPRPFYFGKIRIDPHDDNRVYVLGVSLHVSLDGGKNFRSRVFSGVHADHHAFWIDPGNSGRQILAGDGGVYLSGDNGSTWEHIKNLPLAQFYAICVDMRKPYRVYGGLQDNGSWGGPSDARYREGTASAPDWFRIAAADGFYVQADPVDSDWVYAEGQYASFVRRINVRTGYEKEIKPPAPRAGRPDRYRYNWCAPMLLSPNNSNTLYLGANHLLRSPDRGDRWEEISPDLTRGEPGPSRDFGHTISTIAESPMRAGLLYVGTDDGRVHVSRNAGANWTDVSANIPKVPETRWITRLECSHFDEGTAYLSLSRHRHDDRRPYVFRTTDFGASWTSVSGNLPAEGPVHVVRESPRNRDLLFAGSEFGLFVSLDRGRSWHAFRRGPPAVAVHDLVIHPRERELVIATHGRGAHVLDIAALEEVTAEN